MKGMPLLIGPAEACRTNTMPIVVTEGLGQFRRRTAVMMI